ncbi:GNAT family protein [Amycolatopsis minnesotensis]|uniref:GNAT family protein n=1 Tax=Amycolatopsis minnesotensis TaxID=337894 RepID=A0ABN2SPN7_9PSEU
MTDDVGLRPFREDDLAVLEALLLDPAVAGEHDWTGWSDPRRYRREWAETGMLGDDAGKLMVVRGDERLGFVDWRRRRTARASHCWNMGIALLPAARGRGHGAQAHRLLARYLFAHTTSHRIEADTELGNIAEQRALERAGFTREGVLRGIWWRDGAWRDGVLYSLLRTDPPV